MTYYFTANKSRPATPIEMSEIGMVGADIWEGRLVMPIEAESRTEAWAIAKAKVAEYTAATDIKLGELTWSETNHYGV